MSDQQQQPSAAIADDTTTPTKGTAPAAESASASALRLNAKAQSFVPHLLGTSPSQSPAPAAKPQADEGVPTTVDAGASAASSNLPSTEKKAHMPSPMAPNLLQGGIAATNGVGMHNPFAPQMPFTPMAFTPGGGPMMMGMPFQQPPMPWLSNPLPPMPSMFFGQPQQQQQPAFTFGPPPPSPFFSPPGSNIPSFHQFMTTMHASATKGASPKKNGPTASGSTTPPPNTDGAVTATPATSAKKPLNPACGEYIPKAPALAAESTASLTVEGSSSSSAGGMYGSSVFIPGRGMVPTYMLGPNHLPLPEEPEGEDDGIEEDDGILPAGVTPQLFDMYWKMWLQLQRPGAMSCNFIDVKVPPPTPASTVKVNHSKQSNNNNGGSPTANGGGGMGGRTNSEIMGSPSISVGNATFQAYTSKEPPKFACVLVIGLPSSGKTTVARQLVSELVEEKFAWEFFSGSEHIPESNALSRPPAWDTTKAVFDALSEKIDALLESQKYSERPVKGLLIDKNVKGIEDVYYLYALLKKKGVQLNGIINFDSHDDDKLARRVCKGNSLAVESTKERFKFYRAILSRVMESTKGSNLWHSIDVNDDLQGVIKHLRSKVLGCSVMQNTKPLYICNYTERNASMVHNYDEYARVMTRVCLHAKTQKANQFPGQVAFPPLTTTVMADNSQVRSVRDSFVARRKIDGTQYVLFHDDGSAKLYLIPRHMRAVLRIPAEGWMGVRLDATGTFLLDGELVPLQADHTKEKFLVHDVIFWTEKGETENSCKGSWKVRQERLQSYMANESLPFHGKRSDIVVAYQHYVPISQIARLLGAAEYASEGIVLQSTIKKEHTFLWRSPEQLSVEFRLGAMSPDGVNVATGEKVPLSSVIKDGFPSFEVRVTFALEVFCPKASKYVPYDHYGGVDVTCQPKHHIPVPGSIATCYLVCDLDSLNVSKSSASKKSNMEKKWKFRQLRSDVPTSTFRPLVDTIVDDAIVTLPELTEWFRKHELISQGSVKDIEDAAVARRAQINNAAAGRAAVAAAVPTHIFPASTDAVLMQQYWQTMMNGGVGAANPPLAPALPSMQRQGSNAHVDPMSRQGSTVMSSTPPPMPNSNSTATKEKDVYDGRMTMREILFEARAIQAEWAAREKEPTKRRTEATITERGNRRNDKSSEKPSASAAAAARGGERGAGREKVEASTSRSKKSAAAAAPDAKTTTATAVKETPKAAPKAAAVVVTKASEKKAQESTAATAPAATTTSPAKVTPVKAVKTPVVEAKGDGGANKDNSGSDDDGESPKNKSEKAEKRRGRRGGRKEREKRERREKRAGAEGEEGHEGGQIGAPETAPASAPAPAATAVVAE